MGFADRGASRRRHHQYGELHQGLCDGCVGYLQQEQGRSGEDPAKSDYLIEMRDFDA